MFRSVSIKGIYAAYIVIALPSILLSWYLGFPRGFSASFIGLAVTVFILGSIGDELIQERKIWKEYLMGLTALIIVPIMGYFGSGGVYITLVDLYYVLIGLTVFEIGLVINYRFYNTDEDIGSNRNAIVLSITAVIMMLISYALFIIMDIRVVH